MRSNSGKDESRNNLRDPTLRDSEATRAMKAKRGAGRTTEMGSHARKTGQDGDVRKDDDDARMESGDGEGGGR